MSERATHNYRTLRIGLLNKGMTLASWARKHGYASRSVYNAAKGLRSGTVTESIRRKLEAAAR